jgi:putative peptidoglycan lipid II flippase
MSIVVLWLAKDPDQWLAWEWERRALEISLVVAAGVAAYLGAHLAAGTRFRHLRAPGAV